MMETKNRKQHTGPDTTDIKSSQVGVIGNGTKVEGGIHIHYHSPDAGHPEETPRPPEKDKAGSDNAVTVFINYGKEDLKIAQKLYSDLKSAGVTPWMGDVDLMGGQNWKLEISRAIRECDYFLALLSTRSLSERGYVHKEMKIGLDILDEYPPDKIFVIPVHIDRCDPLDERLQALYPVKLYPSYEDSLKEILRSLAPKSETELDQNQPIPQCEPQPFVDPASLIYPGCAVDVNSPFYIRREADDEVAEGVHRHRGLVTIRGPRQTGKTSLWFRIRADICQSEELRPVFVDFQAVPEAEFESLNVIWQAIATQMEYALDLDDEAVERWNPKAGYDRNFSRFLDRSVFAGNQRPVLICLDNADKVFSTPVRNDFFASLRAFYNRGAYDPAWKNVRWLLITSSEPAFFIENLNQSPFNIGLRVDLGGFTSDEVREFAERHGLSPEDDFVDRIMDYLGGRPCPVHLLLYHLALHPENGEQLFDAESAGGGVFSDYLKKYLIRFQQEPELAEAMKKVMAGKGCRDVRMADRLEAAGLVYRDAAQKVIPACSLYTDYFSRNLD